MKPIFVATAPLTVQVHLGNPKMARILELTIRTLPECEGGGWFMPADQAEAIASCWNSRAQALVASDATCNRHLQVGWSPASTAPQDGEEFLACDRGCASFVCQFWRGEFVSFDPEDGVVLRTFELWQSMPSTPPKPQPPSSLGGGSGQ